MLGLIAGFIASKIVNRRGQAQAKHPKRSFKYRALSIPATRMSRYDRHFGGDHDGKQKGDDLVIGGAARRFDGSRWIFAGGHLAPRLVQIGARGIGQRSVPRMEGRQLSGGGGASGQRCSETGGVLSASIRSPSDEARSAPTKCTDFARMFRTCSCPERAIPCTFAALCSACRFAEVADLCG